MKILTNEKYPIESERNKEIHVPKEVGTVAVWRGEATEVKFKDFRDRLKDAGAGNNPANVNPNVAGVEWGVLDRNTQFREVTVVKKFSDTTLYFSTPPADAPKSIKQRFADLTNSTGSTAAADLDAAKRAQLEYNEKIKEIPRW